MIAQAVCVCETQTSLVFIFVLHIPIVKLIHEPLRHLKHTKTGVNWLIQCYFASQHLNQRKVVGNNVKRFERRLGGEAFDFLAVGDQVKVAPQSDVLETFA